MIERYPDYA